LLGAGRVSQEQAFRDAFRATPKRTKRRASPPRLIDQMAQPAGSASEDLAPEWGQTLRLIQNIKGQQ
jgi:hypothetical protein